MLTIYTSPSCSSCRKAKRWLEEHKIKFHEVNLFTEPIKEKDIEKMLKLSPDGFDSIISTRSKIIKDQNIDIEALSMRQLINIIIEEPSILKRPIMIDGDQMLVGYNEEEIRVFIPKDLRYELVYSNEDPEVIKKRYLENKEKNKL